MTNLKEKKKNFFFLGLSFRSLSRSLRGKQSSMQRKQNRSGEKIVTQRAGFLWHSPTSTHMSKESLCKGGGGNYSGSRKWTDGVVLGERKALASLSQVQSRRPTEIQVDSGGLRAVGAWILFPRRNWGRRQVEILLGSFVKASGIEMASRNIHVFWSFPGAAQT